MAYATRSPFKAHEEIATAMFLGMLKFAVVIGADWISRPGVVALAPSGAASKFRKTVIVR